MKLVNMTISDEAYKSLVKYKASLELKEEKFFKSTSFIGQIFEPIIIELAKNLSLAKDMDLNISKNNLNLQTQTSEYIETDIETDINTKSEKFNPYKALDDYKP